MCIVWVVCVRLANASSLVVVASGVALKAYALQRDVGSRLRTGVVVEVEVQTTPRSPEARGDAAVRQRAGRRVVAGVEVDGHGKAIIPARRLPHSHTARDAEMGAERDAGRKPALEQRAAAAAGRRTGSRRAAQSHAARVQRAARSGSVYVPSSGRDADLLLLEELVDDERIVPVARVDDVGRRHAVELAPGEGLDAGAHLGAAPAPLQERLPDLERRASSSGRSGRSCRPPGRGRPRTGRPRGPGARARRAAPASASRPARACRSPRGAAAGRPRCRRWPGRRAARSSRARPGARHRGRRKRRRQQQEPRLR